MRESRLVGSATLIVRALAIGNLACGVVFVFALVVTIVGHDALIARLSEKYPHNVDLPAVVLLMRSIVVSGLAAVAAVATLFRAMLAMLASVRLGDPFETANANRLRRIGWALFALQMLDLGMGAAAWWCARHQVDFLDWTPSVTGWLAVVVAFVLARIFAVGAAMRDELEGTV